MVELSTNPLVIEWVEKAEADLATAYRELRARKAPNYDAACFHAQQMAEKYLKAYLFAQGLPPPRIHDLVELLALCIQFQPALSLLEADLKSLNAFSTRYRYPGAKAEKVDAKMAIKSAVFVRERMRNWLGLLLGEA